MFLSLSSPSRSARLTAPLHVLRVRTVIAPAGRSLESVLIVPLELNMLLKTAIKGDELSWEILHIASLIQEVSDAPFNIVWYSFDVSLAGSRHPEHPVDAIRSPDRQREASQSGPSMWQHSLSIVIISHFQYIVVGVH